MGETPTRQRRARRGEAVLFVVCLLVVLAAAWGLAELVAATVSAMLTVVDSSG